MFTLAPSDRREHMYHSHHGPDSPRRKYQSVECCSGVLQCWILALHVSVPVSVPVFRVQGVAVQNNTDNLGSTEPSIHKLGT